MSEGLLRSSVSFTECLKSVCESESLTIQTSSSLTIRWVIFSSISTNRANKATPNDRNTVSAISDRCAPSDAEEPLLLLLFSLLRCEVVTGVKRVCQRAVNIYVTRCIEGEDSWRRPVDTVTIIQRICKRMRSYTDSV